MSKIVPDPPLSSVTTLGIVTFGDYGENQKPLFRVNSGMPIGEALEHAASHRGTATAAKFCATFQ